MLDTIELNVWRSDNGSAGRRLRFVRAHITHWWEIGNEHCAVKTTDGETTHIFQSYELVTHLLTSDESEDADHGALDSIIDPRD